MPGKAWTDAEFLTYVEHHSQTERAIFCREHLLRLFELAGSTQKIPEEAAFLELHYDNARVCVDIARARLGDGVSDTAFLRNLEINAKAGMNIYNYYHLLRLFALSGDIFPCQRPTLDVVMPPNNVLTMVKTARERGRPKFVLVHSTSKASEGNTRG
jgi:hypothetical protein